MTDNRIQGDDPFKVFEALAVNAGSGQAEDQGLGNYYYTDPVESRNLDLFIELLNELAPSLGRKVLVAACGDGLETEVLIRSGFNVVATDFSPNMVMATERHLAELGLQGYVRKTT
jgi:2-polyprenyl-3-methyl-5-hydroxy-6-metoxy-1,4-benzoquinol methylase